MAGLGQTTHPYPLLSRLRGGQDKDKSWGEKDIEEVISRHLGPSFICHKKVRVIFGTFACMVPKVQRKHKKLFWHALWPRERLRKLLLPHVFASSDACTCVWHLLPMMLSRSSMHKKFFTSHVLSFFYSLAENTQKFFCTWTWTVSKLSTQPTPSKFAVFFRKLFRINKAPIKQPISLLWRTDTKYGILLFPTQQCHHSLSFFAYIFHGGLSPCLNMGGKEPWNMKKESSYLYLFFFCTSRFLSLHSDV